MALVTGTMQRVMTMEVKEPEVGEPIVGSFAINVMDLKPILSGKVQSTSVTSPCLVLQESRPSWRQARIMAQSLAPVCPISVVGASCSPYFGMPSDRCLGVAWQSLRAPKGKRSVMPAPIPGEAPPVAFPVVAPGSPTMELAIDPMVHLRKDCFGDDMGIIACPAENPRFERPD